MIPEAASNSASVRIGRSGNAPDQGQVSRVDTAEDGGLDPLVLPRQTLITLDKLRTKKAGCENPQKMAV